MGRHKRSKSESDLSKFVETGNRIIRADNAETATDVIVLYRGIKPHAGPYAEQTSSKHAVIGPKKPLDTRITVESHIEGATDSSYISWTPIYETAAKFAGDTGIVMRGVFRKDDLVHPVDNFEGETEYSVLGTVVGAKPYKESQNPTLSMEEKKKLQQTWGKEAAHLEEMQRSKRLAKKNDPLEKRKPDQKHEFTPTGEPVRTWRRVGFFESQLESGPGVPNKPALKRTESLPYLKSKFEPVEEKLLKTSTVKQERVEPEVKINATHVSKSDKNEVESFAKIVEELKHALPKKWQAFLNAKEDTLSNRGISKKSHNDKKAEKELEMVNLRNGIAKITEQLGKGEINIENGMELLKEIVEKVIEKSDELQKGTTLGKPHILFGKSFQLTSSRVSAKLEEFIDKHFGPKSDYVDLP